MIDDSYLLHLRPYDPRRAHEYYLRTRQLKGRKRGGVVTTPPLDRGPGGRPDGSPKSRSGGNAKLEAQKKHLEARLDRLEDVLSKLVEAAKVRSGIETKSDKADKQDKSTSSKDDKKLTATEKKEAAKRSKEYRDKNKDTKPTPASKEIQELQEQIKDIRKEIKDALEDARKTAQSKHRSKTALNGR